MKTPIYEYCASFQAVFVMIPLPLPVVYIFILYNAISGCNARFTSQTTIIHNQAYLKATDSTVVVV